MPTSSPRQQPSFGRLRGTRIVLGMLLVCTVACTPLRDLSTYSASWSPYAEVDDASTGGVDSPSEPAVPEVDAGGSRPDAGGPITGVDAGVTLDAGSSNPCNAPGELATEAGGCYLLASEATTWAAASAACAAWGGTLARIDSATEEAFVSSSVTADTWIGLNDLATEGDMRWDGTGDVSVYVNWATDQPDNFGGDEDCVEVLADSRGWNDLPCTDLHAYLCER